MKHILLIDDEKYLSLVVQACLQKLGGWTVSIAASGQEGLLKAQTVQPDAILLDMMMPDLDGRMVLQRLRSDPLTASTPVVLLTAKVHPILQGEYDQLKIAGVLRKPFEPLQLVPQIAALLAWDCPALPERPT
jgi:CheY-like chemotaxis protein